MSFGLQTLKRPCSPRRPPILTFVVLATLAQAAPSQRAPGGTGNASIEGRVVSASTNDPIRGARVILNTDPLSDSPLVATADENGRFEFHEVPAGTYQLLTTHSGYVRGAYGQPRPGGAGVPIAITSGQAVNSLLVALMPTGAISGTIRNRFGEPVANVAVRALRLSYQDGRRTLLPVQTVRTNDLGDYRLYYLEAGQYIVSALPQEGPTPVASSNAQVSRLTVLPGSDFGVASPSAVTTASAAYIARGILSPSETGETYVPLYFPGVADVSTATKIELRPGETVKSVDFLVTAVRANRIRGQIRDAAGQPVKGVSVVLVPRGDLPAEADRYGAVSDDGSFEFRGIPPGAYDLVASSGNLVAGVATTAPVGAGGAWIDRADATLLSTADMRLMGRVPLRSDAADVENIALTLQPGFRINGKIRFDGVSSTEAQTMLAGIAVQLIPGGQLPQDNDTSGMGLRRARSFSMPAAVAAADGTFTITGAFPGVYRIAIRGASKLPSAAYVKSARIDAVDVLSPLWNLDNEPSGELEIVIGTASGTLGVSVAAETQAAAQGVTVVLIPDPGRRHRYELYFKGVTDSGGKARFEYIPSGDYQAYAWENVEDGAWWDQDFLGRHERQAASVRIEPGRTHEVKLNPIR